MEGKTSGIRKTVTTIQPGEYHQEAFAGFCGFASFRASTDNYEYFKIYSAMVSTKYASKIEEVNSYLFANNPNASVTFEIIDGANDDVLKYIRVTNTGSIPVFVFVGIQNML